MKNRKKWIFEKTLSRKSYLYYLILFLFVYQHFMKTMEIGRNNCTLSYNSDSQNIWPFLITTSKLIEKFTVYPSIIAFIECIYCIITVFICLDIIFLRKSFINRQLLRFLIQSVLIPSHNCNLNPTTTSAILTNMQNPWPFYWIQAIFQCWNLVNSVKKHFSVQNRSYSLHRHWRWHSRSSSLEISTISDI